MKNKKCIFAAENQQIMLVGREQEKQELLDLLESEQSEFVAMYGRRRVGKTYLVRETFRNHFAFQHTGILDAPLREQLAEFRQSLQSAGYRKCPEPANWHEAFHLLAELLAKSKDEKKVVFIDELPWMDTPNSNFIRALDHFWNGWASARKDIIIIVCGSATSWIINKVIMNYGGLHNRLTHQVFLRPFTLAECEQYSQSRKLGFTRKQLLEAYMAFGGIPYYWSFLKKGNSLAQNFDRMFFSDHGEMTREFDALYASLFRHPEPHIAIIKALSTKKSGLTRNEILAETGLNDNITFVKTLKELEQCGFIRKYTCLGKVSKDALYQLMDNFTLFYFKFMQENHSQNPHFWTTSLGTPTHNSWAGLAFEHVCLQHLPQIKAALGFSSVISTAHSWTFRPKPGDNDPTGVQIDLLIDRNDDIINLCEMKYANDIYTIDKAEDAKLRHRQAVFIRESKTKKAVQITMITTYGLAQGGYSDDVHNQVTMEDLFRKTIPI